jgi:hypothetical protein
MIADERVVLLTMGNRIHLFSPDYKQSWCQKGKHDGKSFFIYKIKLLLNILYSALPATGYG